MIVIFGLEIKTKFTNCISLIYLHIVQIYTDNKNRRRLCFSISIEVFHQTIFEDGRETHEKILLLIGKMLFSCSFIQKWPSCIFEWISLGPRMPVRVEVFGHDVKQILIWCILCSQTELPCGVCFKLVMYTCIPVPYKSSSYPTKLHYYVFKGKAFWCVLSITSAFPIGERSQIKNMFMVYY